MIKFIRAMLWLIVTVLVTMGAGLRYTSTNPEVLASGAGGALLANGRILYIVGVLLLGANLMWGATRWIIRRQKEEWGAGKIIGKLIGGGIWRFLVFAPIVILLLIFAVPKAKNGIIAKVEADRITARSDSWLSADYLDDIRARMNEMSADELKKVASEMFMTNVEFDTDASGNINKSAAGLFTQNAYAANNVKTLNKAVLSSNKHFVVFYTDTGEDKISGEKAAEIGEMLEDFIDDYKREFGFDYKNEEENYHDGAFGGKRKDINKVMEASGISADTLDTAMPVYVVNPYDPEGDNKNVLATYAGNKFAETGTNILVTLGSVFGEETARFYNSSPVLPFINILPANVENESLALVTAHEFGHHYNGIYCYDNFGESCNNNDFVDETIPNFMSATAVANQPEGSVLGNHHNYWYINSVNLPVYDEEHNGYGSFAFLKNYQEVVGQQPIFDALILDDAYGHLYRKAGKEKMKEVMRRLAERNLTNDYGDKKSYYTYADNLPAGEVVPDCMLCSDEYGLTWKSGSVHYFYFAPERYTDRILLAKESDGYALSLLGQKGGRWTKLDLPEELYFENYTDYDVLAIAAANYAEPEDVAKEFEMEMISVELRKYVDTVEQIANIDNPFVTMGDCVAFYTDDFFSAVTDFSEAFRGYDADLDAEIGQFQEDVAEAKAEAAGRKVTVCAKEMNGNADFDTVKQSLMSGGISLSLMDMEEDGERMATIMTVDLLGVKAYAKTLVKSAGEMYLISVTVE